MELRKNVALGLSVFLIVFAIAFWSADIMAILPRPTTKVVMGMEPVNSPADIELRRRRIMQAEEYEQNNVDKPWIDPRPHGLAYKRLVSGKSLLCISEINDEYELGGIVIYDTNTWSRKLATKSDWRSSGCAAAMATARQAATKMDLYTAVLATIPKTPNYAADRRDQMELIATLKVVEQTWER